MNYGYARLALIDNRDASQIDAYSKAFEIKLDKSDGKFKVRKNGKLFDASIISCANIYQNVNQHYDVKNSLKISQIMLNDAFSDYVFYDKNMAENYEDGLLYKITFAVPLHDFLHLDNLIAILDKLKQVRNNTHAVYTALNNKIKEFVKDTVFVYKRRQGTDKVDYYKIDSDGMLLCSHDSIEKLLNLNFSDNPHLRVVMPLYWDCSQMHTDLGIAMHNISTKLQYCHITIANVQEMICRHLKDEYKRKACRLKHKNLDWLINLDSHSSNSYDDSFQIIVYNNIPIAEFRNVLAELFTHV